MTSKTMNKTINRLSKYIGKEIIRTNPTYKGDGSYTDSTILLLGFTPDGKIRYRNTTLSWLFGDKEDTLPISFTDMNWTTYKKALRSGGTKLSKWRGKKIRRINPTTIGDRSFIKEPVTLLSASKSHMVVKYDDGSESVLDWSYTKFEDWIIA